MNYNDKIKLYLIYKKLQIDDLICKIYTFYKHPKLNVDLKTIIHIEGSKLRLHKIQNELEKEKDEWERQMINIENNVILSQQIQEFPQIPMYYKTLYKNTSKMERLEMCIKLLSCNCCERHNEDLPDLDFIFNYHNIIHKYKKKNHNNNNRILNCCSNCPYEEYVETLDRDGNIYHKKCTCSCRHYIRELYHLICLDNY